MEPGSGGRSDSSASLCGASLFGRACSTSSCRHFRAASMARSSTRPATPPRFPTAITHRSSFRLDALGMRYVEPWEVDFKSGKWDTVLAEFNQWAAESH